MKIVKKMYLRDVVKDGKKEKKWLPSYFLNVEGCRPVLIRCVFPEETSLLDFIAEWGGFVNADENKQTSTKNN